jgi:type I restriction-modification system
MVVENNTINYLLFDINIGRLMQMTNKTNANIGFEKHLWDAACVLWGHIPAAEYRKVIIGLIFLRYVSSAFDKRYQELVAEGDGFEDDRDAYTMENIFFVPKEARWDTIAKAAHTPEIGSIIDNAMRAIEAENKTLKDVLPKNYASPDLDKQVLGDVVDIFTNRIDMSDKKQSEDLLGRTYEYCIAKFAEKEGKSGGEFYTPSSIVNTLVSILKPFDNCRVYDCCCGSGGMFVQSAKFIRAHSGNRGSISIYGQEANADTWKMAKMNMAIRGIDADLGPYQADTFTNDLHPTLKADFILANPPYNYSPWNQEKLLDDVRWKYGTPPAGNANYAWIQHMIHHLAPNGKIGLVLANIALSSQQCGEGEIRQKIIEDDLIEGIISMPSNLFYSVTLSVTLWFITKGKKQKGKTLFIDARHMGHMVDQSHRDFSEEDIQKLATTFEKFQNGTLENVKGFCYVATTEDIAKQDYILTPGRYVGIEDQEDDGEPFDEKMTRLTSELSEMFKKSHKLEDEIKKKIGALGYEI